MGWCFDIFVLSSHAEGTSMSILEAAASGVSVIATDVGGNATCIEGGRSGRLIPPSDVPALIDALDSLLTNPAERATLAERGRGWVIETFGLDAMLDRYETLYGIQPRRRAVAGAGAN
jgi:glycosyltransferase involved in cell wall biosynthesis